MIKVEWKWNVPNALSLLRLFLVPVIVVTYWLSDPNEIPYVSIGALVLSGISDSLDGIIARHFNQITDIGKLLDPVADKLTQVAVVVCLSLRYRELLPLRLICVVKELCQAVGGLLLLHRGEKVRGARWFGKVSTFLFYGVMILIVAFPEMPHALLIGLVALVGAAMLFAFVNYLRMYCQIRKEQKESAEDETPQDVA